MMKSSKDVLWSLDLFGSERSPLSPTSKGFSSTSTTEAARVSAATPEQEAAYLRYGSPVLRLLAAEGPTLRRGHIRDRLADHDPNFDFDVLCLAMRELERRQAIRIAERDARSGDHLYSLTPAGMLLAI